MPTFISKASEDTAEGGLAQEQLPHITPVSQWGTKPSLVPSALPAHTVYHTQDSLLHDLPQS